MEEQILQCGIKRIAATTTLSINKIIKIKRHIRPNKVS